MCKNTVLRRTEEEERSVDEMFLERGDKRHILWRRAHHARVESRQERVGQVSRRGVARSTAGAEQRLLDALRADDAPALVARVARRARRDVVLTRLARRSAGARFVRLQIEYLMYE